MATDQHVLVTVLLHHDQSMTLDEIMAHCRKTGFYRDFPPEGSEVVVEDSLREERYTLRRTGDQFNPVRLQ